VQSLVSGASEPPPEALARAELFARTATRMAPREPWGPLAHCDIAVRWGDRALVDRCLDRLVAAAPEHVETRRAVAALGPRTPVVAILAWSLLAVAALATGGHAVRARLVARRGRAPSLPEAGDPAAAGPITGAAPPGSRAHS
jgi:hypothetical protein